MTGLEFEDSHCTLNHVHYNLATNMASFGSYSMEYLGTVRVATILFQATVSSEIGHLLFSHPLEEIINIIKFKFLERVSYLEINIYCKKALDKIIQLIGHEIARFFISLDEISNQYYSKEINFWNNICWTRHGTINRLKTILQIINHSNQSLFDKYKLACNYCQVEKIRYLYNELPPNFIDDYIFFTPSHKLTHLLMYWTYIIRDRGEMTKFTELINGAATEEYILKFAILHWQEVAVQYIWENLATDSMKAHLINYAKLAMDRPDNSSILFYLFKQMNKEQCEQICVEEGHNLLQTLKHSSGLCNVLIEVSKFVLKFLPKMDVTEALRSSIFCWQAKLINLDQYQNIWKEIDRYFKYEFEENFGQISRELLFDSILMNNDTHTMIFFMRMGTVEDKRFLFFNENQTLMICSELICSGPGELDFVNLFLRESLSTEDIVEFKLKFISQQFPSICCELIEKNKYELLDKIILILFGESDIKSQLPYKENAFIVRHLLTCGELKDVQRCTALNKFINWCLEGNRTEISICKRTLFSLQDNPFGGRNLFFKRLKKLIFRNKLKLASNYWKWIFDVNAEEIGTPKEKLIRIKKILYTTSRKKCCGLIKNFITSCFKGEEMDELKEALKDSETLSLITRDLIHLEELSQIEDIFNWCYDFKENRIKSFKENFMQSIGCTLLLKLSKHNKIRKANALLEWFNPSSKAAKSFEEKFNSFVNDKIKLEEAMKHNRNVCWNKLKKRIAKSLEILKKFTE